VIKTFRSILAVLLSSLVLLESVPAVATAASRYSVQPPLASLVVGAPVARTNWTSQALVAPLVGGVLISFHPETAAWLAQQAGERWELAQVGWPSVASFFAVAVVASALQLLQDPISGGVIAGSNEANLLAEAAQRCRVSKNDYERLTRRYDRLLAKGQLTEALAIDKDTAKRYHNQAKAAYKTAIHAVSLAEQPLFEPMVIWLFDRLGERTFPANREIWLKTKAYQGAATTVVRRHIDSGLVWNIPQARFEKFQRVYEPALIQAVRFIGGQIYDAMAELHTAMDDWQPAVRRNYRKKERRILLGHGNKAGIKAHDAWNLKPKNGIGGVVGPPDLRPITGRPLQQVQWWAERIALVLSAGFDTSAQQFYQLLGSNRIDVYSSLAQSTVEPGLITLNLAHNVHKPRHVFGLGLLLGSELGHANEMTAVRWNDDSVDVSSAVSEVFDAMARLLCAAAFGPHVFEIENTRLRTGAREGRLLLDALDRTAISVEDFVGGDKDIAQQILDDVVIHMRQMPKFADLGKLGKVLKGLISDFFKVTIYDDAPVPYPAHHRIADVVVQDLIYQTSGDITKAARALGQLLTPRYLHGFQTLASFQPILHQSVASLPQASNDREFRQRQEQGLSELLMGAATIEDNPIWIRRRGQKRLQQSAMSERYSTVDELVLQVLRRHLTADQLSPLVRYLGLRLRPAATTVRPSSNHNAIRHLGSAA
jgi:hypothetical protein